MGAWNEVGEGMGTASSLKPIVITWDHICIPEYCLCQDWGTNLWIFHWGAVTIIGMALERIRFGVVPLFDRRCTSKLRVAFWRRQTLGGVETTSAQMFRASRDAHHAAICLMVLYSIQGTHQNLYLYGYGSIPINTIFRGMNIHLPAILMWTTGVQGFDTMPYVSNTDPDGIPSSHPPGMALLPHRGNASLRASPEEKRSLPEAPAWWHPGANMEPTWNLQERYPWNLPSGYLT